MAQFQLLLRPVIHDDDSENSTFFIFFLICTAFCIVVLRLILVFHKMSAPPTAILQMDLQ